MYNGHLVSILGIENTEESHSGKIVSQAGQHIARALVDKAHAKCFAHRLMSPKSFCPGKSNCICMCLARRVIITQRQHSGDPGQLPSVAGSAHGHLFIFPQTIVLLYASSLVPKPVCLVIF